MLEQEVNVLVCTTIIETGVDLPNANTLIIENADRMGLSQLHQLRGRVGRSNRKAYAYFTYPPHKVLSEISVKRLNAIREFTEFGSGFKIAMRDLELRGAGNILGAQQHGHMENVGYDMYLKLLAEAVSEEKGEENTSADIECLVDLNIEAHIPESYFTVCHRESTSTDVLPISGAKRTVRTSATSSETDSVRSRRLLRDLSTSRLLGISRTRSVYTK